MKTYMKMPSKHQRSSLSRDIKLSSHRNIPSEELQRGPAPRYEIDSAYIDVQLSISGAVQKLERPYLTVAVDPWTGRIVHAMVQSGTIREAPTTIRRTLYQPQLQGPAERALLRLLRLHYSKNPAI